MVSLKDVTRERVMVTEICGPVKKKDKEKKMSPYNHVMLMVIKTVIKRVKMFGLSRNAFFNQSILVEVGNGLLIA